MTLPERRPTFRPRWVVGSLLALGLVAAVWSGLWLLASAWAGSSFDAWIAAEAQAGLQWTCPDRRTGGYPFGLQVHCVRPTFRAEIAGRTASGIVEGLEAGLQLDRPGTLSVDLLGPMNLRADDDGYDLMASWSTLRIAAGLPPLAPSGTAIEATRLAVTLSVRQQGDFNARAAHLTGQAQPATGAAADMPGGTAFGFAASGIGLPTVDGFMGSDQPIDAEGQGVLTRADLLDAPSVKRLEAWRTAGGLLRVAALKITKGDFQGQASGTLLLDASHRMAGHLDTELSGFEPLAARFGIPLGGLKLGGLLTSLLGGKPADPSPAAGDAVRLPLVFKGGRVSVGPFETGARIDPMY